jgi:hypothetical protein
MKRLILMAAPTLLGVGIILAQPASAQVRFGIGPEGPEISVGRDRDAWERRRIRRELRSGRYYYGDPMVTGSTRRCRLVTIRDEDEYGDVTVRRIRRCR